MTLKHRYHATSLRALFLTTASLAAIAAWPGAAALAQDSQQQNTQQQAEQQPETGPDATAEDAVARADENMAAVLKKLTELGVKPLGTIPVEAARTQPTPADAVKAVLEDMGKSIAPEKVARTEDITIPGPAGAIPARVYIPDYEGEGPLPVILYFHGGGWVIADIDTYDATPRAMANAANAIVISSHYRQAPEHPFPAAHEDAIAAYEWVVENVGRYNGDTARVAVMGESAGGNLAANVAIAARDRGWQVPVHQALVYPVAGTAFDTESYAENANAVPLSRDAMKWFFDKTVAEPSDMRDPRLDLVDMENFANLPPATIVTAEIDPLRSEGQTYADKLQAAGVDAAARNFEGVTHEFFGMAPLVDKAKNAQAFVAERLRAAFDKGS